MPNTTDPALDRGMQMLHIPMKDLPPLALGFAKHLCKQYGMCIETMLTAYTVYAQIVEKLECHDDLYTIRGWEKEWFISNGWVDNH